MYQKFCEYMRCHSVCVPKSRADLYLRFRAGSQRLRVPHQSVSAIPTSLVISAGLCKWFPIPFNSPLSPSTHSCSLSAEAASIRAMSISRFKSQVKSLLPTCGHACAYSDASHRSHVNDSYSFLFAPPGFHSPPAHSE